MADDFGPEVGPEVQPGTPPGDVPAPPAGVDDDLDVDDGGPEEPDGEGPDASGGEDREQPPKEGSAARRAWDTLEKKFLHIADPEARREAVAEAFWRKNNYASRVTKENERLRREIDELRAGPREPEPPPEPETPHPDVVAIETKIQGLYDKMQAIQTEQKERLDSLAKLNVDIGVAENRLTDAFDEQKPTWQHKLDLAKTRYDGARQQYLYAQERLAELNDRLVQELGNLDWVKKYRANERQREQSEQQDRAVILREFPGKVDNYIAEQADDLGLPKDERIRQSVWRHVNRALMVELRRLAADDVESVDVRGLVRQYVQEYAADRDITTRSTFARRSEEKLRVAGRARPSSGAEPRAGSPPVPASARPPVPVALLASDTTPAMARARQVLVNRFGSGR